MRRTLRAGVGAALAGLVVTGAPGGAGAATPPESCAPALAPGPEREMTVLIAERRRAVEAPKVKGDARLLRAGRAKSRAMARGARFAHAAGLPWTKGRAGGQNIAMAMTASDAFRAMLGSPGHRANITSRAWRFAAVGAARACSGRVYFTINFLGPPVA